MVMTCVKSPISFCVVARPRLRRSSSVIRRSLLPALVSGGGNSSAMRRRHGGLRYRPGCKNQPRMPNWKTTPRLEGDIMNAKAIAAALAIGWTVSAAAAQAAETLTVPFDFSRQAIGLDITVKGTPLYMILDTGVDPSGI